MAPLVPRVSHWAAHPETYPIVAIISLALSLIPYFGVRALILNPDVVLSRTERGQPLKDSERLEAKAAAWTSSHQKHVADSPSHIHMFGRTPHMQPSRME